MELRHEAHRLEARERIINADQVQSCHPVENNECCLHGDLPVEHAEYHGVVSGAAQLGLSIRLGFEQGFTQGPRARSLRQVGGDTDILSHQPQAEPGIELLRNDELHPSLCNGYPCPAILLAMANPISPNPMNLTVYLRLPLVICVFD